MVYGALKFSEAKALVYGVLKLSEAKALIFGALKFSEAKYKAGNPRISCLNFLFVKRAICTKPKYTRSIPSAYILDSRPRHPFFSGRADNACTKTLIAGAQKQNVFMKNARLTPTGILVSSLTALIYWIVLPNSRSFAK